MVAPSDESRDPEGGRLAELAERRARRAVDTGLIERAERAERTVSALERRLDEAEGRLEVAQRERSTLSASLEQAQRDLTAALQREFAEQRVRAEQEGDASAALAELEADITRLGADHDAAEARAAALTRALQEARHEVDRAKARADAERQAVAVDERRDGRRQELGELQALADDLRGSLLGERAAREEAEHALASMEGEQRRTSARLADAQAAAARERTRADRAEAAHTELAAELTAHAARQAQVETALDALREELEQARAEGSDRAEREAAVEALVGDLVETAHGLPAEFERELEGLTAERDAEIARERGGFAAELAVMEQRVGELRRRLTRAAEQLRDELEEERSARWVAEAELAREMSDRALAEERAARALDALTLEVARLRVESAANPFYDVAPAGPSVPSADHPALARPAASAGAPAVVDDLVRAMDRLRAGAGETAASSPPADAPTTGSVVLRGDHPEVRAAGLDADPPLVETHTTTVNAAPPAAPAPPLPPSLSGRVAADGVAETDWFSKRLAAFARTDEAAAERLLLSSLAVQATTVIKDVSYELELPLSGRYRVEVVRGSGVSVAPVDATRPQKAEFRIEAPVGAVAALAGGAAPRRLADVAVRGRRRRLRRLLRALGAPVGLSRLQGAGAKPPPADLLAMLCDGVPPDALLGADFTVAYDVSGPRGVGARRVVVRARPDGRLELENDAGTVPDAALALDVPELLAVLAGSTSVAVTGDHRAADTLHHWLRGVQGR